MFVGLTGEESVSAVQLRDTAEWLIRRRLLGLPGIAQVVPIGGSVKQVEVVLSPERLMQNRLGTSDVLQALQGISESTPGGFHVASQEEYLIRGIGRLSSLDALGKTLVQERDGVPILLADVADVRFGEMLRRGEAALDGQHGVVLKVQKQPQANTLELTQRLDVRGERFTGLSSVAQIDKTTGPNLINRENAQRRIVVTANVSGRDARKLRDDHGAQKLLLIAINGYGQDQDRWRSRQAGFDHHLVKPIDLRALLALLEA